MLAGRDARSPRSCRLVIIAGEHFILKKSRRRVVLRPRSARDRRPAADKEASGNSSTRNGRRLVRTVPSTRHQPGRTPCPAMRWVDSCLRNAAALRQKSPTEFETTQRIVKAAGNCDKFGRHGAIETRPRNFAVRSNDPSLLRTIPSSTRAAKGRKSARRVCAAARRQRAQEELPWSTQGAPKSRPIGSARKRR
jgi:hypothetical protein